MAKFENHHGDTVYLNDYGQYHREDGPAIINKDGTRWWFINGKLHREDGPAAEFIGGMVEYFLYDKFIECSSLEEFLKIVKMKAFW